MAYQVELYDTSTLLGVMREFAPIPNYWLNLCFGRTVTFDDEFIDFSKITEGRVLAPLVVPMAKGKPLFSESAEVQRFKPAYIKPLDAVTAARMLQRRPDELLLDEPLSPEARMDSVIADITRVHRAAIERRWEWLAAEAVIKGSVLLSGEDYPERTVNFRRASGHTIDLNGAWDDPDHDIVQDIQDWRDMVRTAQFGGPTNRLTIGTNAWTKMRKNNSLRAELDTTLRGTSANFVTGLRSGAEAEFVGSLGANLDLWVYSDYYETVDAAGAKTTVPFMAPEDVVLTGPNVQGVRAFGAILDKKAGIKALPIFPKMYDEENPSATYVLSQSAPLMVPINPNNTLRATVVDVPTE